MARYKDCDKCYHRHACAGDTDKWNYYGECPHYINSTDVVPKSEVAEIIEETFKRIRENFVNTPICNVALSDLEAELKKKYTEDQGNDD